MVRLSSSDGQEFTVVKEIACQSVLIKNMLEDLGDDEDAAIPLPNVAGTVLAKVIDYATHHKDDAPLSPEDENKNITKSSEDIDEWDKEFINVDQGTLFEIILAANYLDMKGLLDLGCKTVANMIKGKTVEEIRKTFNIVNDFTPEEEEQIRKENEWCEDR
ncbi:hypothetical protein BATDEDRAFT_20074 [Batrachochytrium dendrobatidis JAM81]|uniref:E3 ubiquitin ligase complex SCF subunit n=2 Tax=Batrachochytrium dendrobatidis TaxID=109871 RepID=F4P6F0_BATDJ|nr:uncharacterized protein BATDEDRAFT_20074 [Batrachochytrium dendrobatidis JAM81]EGF79598.1 hypothetical protein BATDEDRAFT_20074 [Batrachochytrium dendrobatidis JAM81]KAJ8323069.1 hypothetical protein O5D80_008577 [Batrachochytrium dendrobatidis]KAK5665613.1 hypothetical protein QVD99_007262 [Batrachochytrium dendrobatidis]OAJ42539.1 hypothetical protein BDEG_25988 [Batrachochytrium dendrobatidis JEL423]|eukprot:XP_006679842.1 hypothetical protein BATDEDRAFT_20074 [Batrachochytrium dendrobatidis JAM81]